MNILQSNELNSFKHMREREGKDASIRETREKKNNEIRHVISACAGTSSVHDSHVISACSVT